MERILIKNTTIVPMTTEIGEVGELYFEGDIAIEDDRIASVGPSGSAPAGWEGARVIDGRGKVALPGLVNCHTHAAMTLFRGYADDLPLMQWLEEKIWPMEAKLEGDDIYWGTMLACLEMLRSGTTTFADMYFCMDRAAEAVAASGMRAVLARGLIGTQGNAKKALREARELVRTCLDIGDGRITAMLGPHAPYTCPPDFLREVADAAGEMGLGIHIHVAETAGEVQDMAARYGQPPVKLLEEIGVFEVPVLAAHCVHLQPEEIDILRTRRVGVAHNPESNMKLASGVAPVPAMLAGGVNVGLGTDGAASNNNLDLFEEMRTAALLHKVHVMDPTAVSAYDALSMATRLGARALGLGDEIGVLEAGKKADIILIDFEKPHLYPRHDVLAHLVYAARADDVDTVMVDGRIVVSGGKVAGLDQERIMAEAAARAERLRRE